MSKVASRKSKVEGRRSRVVGTHGRASVLQNRTASQHNQFMLRRFIFRLGSRSGFSHTKTTKCELAMLEQHILLNVFAHKNLFPTSTKCRQIESPQLQCGPWACRRARIELFNRSILGAWIFLLRLGIINAGHFDKLNDRPCFRQAQGPNRIASPPQRLND